MATIAGCARMSDQLARAIRSELPRVGIWRDEWLPDSETFILDQIGAMQQWHPVPFAVYLSGHPRVGAWIPFPTWVSARWARWSIKTGFGSRRASRELGATRVSILHAHFGTGGVTALPIARRARIPLIVTFHGFDATRLLRGDDRESKNYRRDLRDLFEYADALIAVSEFIAKNLRQAGAPEDKIRVLPIGTRVLEAENHSERETTRVLFVGRLVPKKGVDDLLHAIAMLDEPHRSIHVTVVGGGSERSTLERQAATLGLNVVFTGPQSHEQVREQMRQASIFVAPSRTARDGDAEGFGMVFLEAAQARLPAVAYRHGGVVEAVLHGETGLLADEGDVAQLSEYLMSLISDPARAEKLGMSARERVLRDFRLEQRTLDLESLYDEVNLRRARIS